MRDIDIWDIISDNEEGILSSKYKMPYDYQDVITVKIPIDTYKRMEQLAKSVPYFITEVKKKTVRMFDSKNYQNYEDSYDMDLDVYENKLKENNIDLARRLKYLSTCTIKEFKAWQENPSKTLIEGAVSMADNELGKISI